MADISKPKKEVDLDNQSHDALMGGGTLTITPNPIPLPNPLKGADNGDSYRSKISRGGDSRQ